MRRTALIILALVLSVLAAACGGEDTATDDATDAADAAADAADDVEVAATEAEEAADDAADAVAGLDSAACQEAQEALTAVPAALGTAASGQADVDAIAAQAEAFANLSDQAPEEYADDFDVLGTAFSDIASALEGLDLSGSTTPTQEQIDQLTELSTQLTGPEIQEATTNISTYFANGCQ